MSSASQLLYGSLQGRETNLNSVSLSFTFPTNEALLHYTLPSRVRAVTFIDADTVVYIDYSTDEWVKYDVSTGTELLRSSARPISSTASYGLARSLSYPGRLMTGSTTEQYNYYDESDLSFIKTVNYASWPSGQDIEHITITYDPFADFNYVEFLGNSGSAYQRLVSRFVETDVDDNQGIGPGGFAQNVNNGGANVTGSHCRNYAGAAAYANQFSTYVIVKDGYTDFNTEVDNYTTITGAGAASLSGYNEVYMSNYIDNTPVVIGSDTTSTDVWVMNTKEILEEDLPAP